MIVSAPLLLGSVFGLLAGRAFTVLLMALIRGEDRLLVRNLDGYLQYTQNVRYRLFLFLW